MIGLWYAMFSFRYMAMSTLDQFITSSVDVLIHQVVRSILVLVSLVLYMCMSRAYKYRVRDWVVHVQWMVEDIFERQIDQEDSYMRKCAAEDRFLDVSSSTNNYGSLTQGSQRNSE